MKFIRVYLIVIISMSLLTSCANNEGKPQNNATSLSVEPDKSFKSQPILKHDVISTVSHFQPSLFEHHYSATFPERSMKLSVTETYKYKPKTRIGAQLGQLYVDGKDLTNLPAGAYIRSLLSNLRYVEISDLECKTWVEKGCDLTFKVNAEVISTNADVSCIVAINMGNKVTDSCEL